MDVNAGYDDKAKNGIHIYSDKVLQKTSIEQCLLHSEDPERNSDIFPKKGILP